MLFKSEKVDHVRGSRSRGAGLGPGPAIRLQIKPFVWVTRKFIEEPRPILCNSLHREIELKSLIMAQIERWRQA